MSDAKPVRLRVNITVDRLLHERLAAAAKARGWPNSRIIEEALLLYLDLPYPPETLQSIEDLPPQLRLLIARAVEDYLARRPAQAASAEP
jgi:predicted transcriptional regulator